MTNLSQLFKQPPVRPHHRWLVPVLVILSIAGFADATYLTVEHFANVVPPCTLHGCETVLTSIYSTIFGVPVALLGALFYFALLVMYFLYFEARDVRALNFALHFSVFGILFDIWFISAQAFIIHAWCQYCLLSAAISMTIFFLSYWSLFGSPKIRLEE